MILIAVLLSFFVSAVVCTAQTWTKYNGLHRSDIRCMFERNGILLAGTGYGGVFVSLDSGNQWAHVPDVTSSTINGFTYLEGWFFTATKTGMFRSADGIKWTKTNNLLNTKTFEYPTDYHCIASVERWIVVGTESRLYRSNDLGESWIRCDDKPAFEESGAFELAVIDSSIYALPGIGQRVLYKSDDYGSTWEKVKPNGISDFVNVSSVQSYQNELIVQCHCNAMVVSTKDNGVSWQEYFGSDFMNLLFNGGIMSFAKTDSFTFVGTGENGLYRCSNQDKNTSVSIRPKDNVCIDNIYIFNDMLFAVSAHSCSSSKPENGGLYRSTNNGDTWQLLDLYHEVNTLYKGTNYLFAGTDGGSVYMLINRTWRSQALSLFHYRSATVHALNEYDGWLYAGTRFGVFGASIDIYDKDAILDKGMGEQPVTALVREGATLFAATKNTSTTYNQSGAISTRVDNIYQWNGSQWKLSRTGLPTKITINALTNYNSLLIAGTSAGVYRSKNKGSSWESSMIGMGELPVNRFTISAGRLFAATDNGVYYSDDGGGSWMLPSRGFQHRVLSLAADEGIALAGTDGNGLFRSTDSGETWQLIGDVMGDNTITAMVLNYQFLTVATKTKGTFSHPNALLLPVRDNDTTQLHKDSDILVYPNPARDHIVITPLGRDFSNGYTAMLYDNLGKPVITRVAAPKEQLVIDASGIAIGVYYVVLQSSNATIVRMVSVTH